ncbi:N-acetylmuramoyl-L-alanine amidase [Streptomyces sp. RB5]|uniref:N-acetylmuramoyl-L-alanine amidase n=1 Tax=Streptomyces smaragdinus TaxID=2585196 RepID=A0A7K0CD03_9ACTN|nr:N-acetylmuramoyl-L-alanine amidase [Streptomyces smaragdinus]
MFAGWLLWQYTDGEDAGPKEPRAAASSPSARPSPSKAGVEPRIDKKPLTGKVVVLDPGHNPNNRLHTAEINRKVNIGTNAKECDTTGAATDSGYAEARFTLDVARRARTLLRAQGATVKLTQDGQRAWGPCVDERAAIGNEAHADAVVSIHADGAGPGQRGFHVILPKAISAGGADTRKIAGPSRELGLAVRKAFEKRTGSDVSNYLGGGSGFTVRSDLGGLNLSTVPKVFIECGNMRDSKDAAQLTAGGWRQRAAHGIVDGITAYLNG